MPYGTRSFDAAVEQVSAALIGQEEGGHELMLAVCASQDAEGLDPRDTVREFGYVLVLVLRACGEVIGVSPQEIWTAVLTAEKAHATG